MSTEPDSPGLEPGSPIPASNSSAPDLPAPYVSPWVLLGRDLLAVLASVGLRLRELWRRNRECDLSVPGIWPAVLAPLFWPLLLALALGLVVGLPVALLHAPPPVAEVSQPVFPAGDPPAPPALSPPPAVAPEIPAPAVLQLDPLLELLASEGPEPLIRAALPDPAESRLVLELDNRFLALPPARRRQLAQQWLARAVELGYDQLQLRTAAGQLLGRRARVGSGMILFSADPEP